MQLRSDLSEVEGNPNGDVPEVIYGYMLERKLGAPTENPIKDPYNKEVVERAIRNGIKPEDLYLALSVDMLQVIPNLDQVVSGLSDMWGIPSDYLRGLIIYSSLEAQTNPEFISKKKERFKGIRSQMLRIKKLFKIQYYNDHMIRRFEEKDAETCSKILYECIDKQVELAVNAKEYIKRKATPREFIIRSKKMLIVVYENQKEVLGMGALDKNEIRTMFTKITSQGKGIGSKILSYLEKEAKKRGYKMVFLHAALNAVNFYKKKGYSIVKKLSEKKDDVVIDNVLMEKLL